MVFAYDCAVDRYTFDGGKFGGYTPVVALNQADCKMHCDQDATCGQWSWNRKKATGGRRHQCTLSTGWANPKYDPDSFTVPKGGNSSCTCPTTTPTTALVGQAVFPPATEFDSKALFGATAAEGIGQPFGLECWKKDENFHLQGCGTTDLRRVHETSVGNEFLANCKVMPKVEREGTVPVDEAWCEAKCKSDLSCAVWQFVKPQVPAPPNRPHWGCYQSQANADTCDQARVYTVAGNAKKMYTVAGGRVQHGNVRVIGKLDNYQVLGLQQAFTHRYSTEAVDKAMCKELCYSNMYCTVWQFYELTGVQSTVPSTAATGCWVEDPINGKALEYPLALNNKHQFDVAHQGNHTWITGELIQHYCMDPIITPILPPVTTPAPSSSVWSWLLPLLLLVALVSSAAVALLFCCGDPKKKKKTRSARSRALEEVEAPLQVVSTPVIATPTYYAAQPAQMVQLQPRPTQVMPQPVMAQPVMAQPQLVQAPVQYATQPAVNPGIRF